MKLGDRVSVIEKGVRDTGIYLGKHQMKEIMVFDEMDESTIVYQVPEQKFKYSLGDELEINGNPVTVGQTQFQHIVEFDDGHTGYYETTLRIFPEVDQTQIPELGPIGLNNRAIDTAIINKTKQDLESLNRVDKDTLAHETLKNLVKNVFIHNLAPNGTLKIGLDTGFFVRNTRLFFTILDGLYSNQRVTLYAPYETLEYTLPVSCSFSPEIPIRSSDQILRIDVPKGYPFMSLSLPPWASQEDQARARILEINAQDRYGVFLPPSQFQVIHSDKVEINERVISVFTVTVTPI